MEKIQKSPDERALSLGTKISYGTGDLASQFVWSFIGSYLMIFYTDVAMLPAAAISLIFLGARVWDAVNDPMMGAIAERTKSKYGRFRPYLLYGAPFLVIVYVLCFMAPDFNGNMAMKIAYAAVTYIALGMLYTAVNLPYGALMTVMSKNLEDRSDLSTWRMIGSNVGSLILSAVSLPLILYFGHGDQSKPLGYTVTAIVLGIIALPLFYLVFFRCKEVIRVSPKAASVPIIQSFKSCLNRPFLCLFALNSLALVGKFGQAGVAMYYYKYVLQRSDLAALLMVLLNGSTALGIFLFARVSKQFGKKNTTMASFLLAGVFQIAIYFVSYDNIPLVMLFTVCTGLTRFGLPVATAMLADVIDYTEDRTGIRADGTAYSVYSFGTKLSSALVGSVGVILLVKVGYVANAVQTAEAMRGISMVVNVLPGACWLLALIPLALYNLSEEKYAVIRARLDAREQSEVRA
ncbi:MAG: MFS transporter [Acetatifactor sp.]